MRRKNMSSKEAVEKFRSGCNCSQAVFAGYSEKFGISENDALKISSGFGGGMGGLQKTCGAVTGAFMLLGCGLSNPEDSSTKQKVTDAVKEFNRKFEGKLGSCSCLKLLGCDRNTDEGVKFFEENNLKETKCVKYVEEACRLVEEILILP
jgi:C_GCAxxG_C_C family probable redox protein